MDGNGRWAKQRGLPRALSAIRPSVNALKRRTVEAAPETGDRPPDRGSASLPRTGAVRWPRSRRLLGLLKRYFASDLARLEREGVRVRIIGRRDDLAPDILAVIERAEARTRFNERFNLQVAFNYGGRADITEAARRYVRRARGDQWRGQFLGRRDLEEEVCSSVSCPPAAGPPPDLIVRTSGERRLSNFLLWEAAYAELVFQDVLWPDYGPEHLKAALDEFQARERRYGGADVDDVRAAG